MASYLLDTTAIIDHLRGDKKVSSYLINIAKRGDLCGCCCINVAETYNAMKGKEKKKTEKFIESLYYYEVTKEIAKLSGSLKQKYAKKGNSLSISDVIIGATALTYRLILITKNIRHYPFSELEILNI